MKTSLSGLELHYLLKELKSLEGSRLDKIILPSYDEIIIEFFKKSEGKYLLKLHPPNFVCLTETKLQGIETPSSFLLTLRKHLANAFLETIIQKGLERIIEFIFIKRNKENKKEEEIILIIELFSKGNILLCNSSRVILAAMQTQFWKDRSLKKGESYIPPPQGKTISELDVFSINNLLRNEKKTIGKFLAVNLGFGGLYSDEICAVTTIDKKTNKITQKDFESIKNTIKNLKQKTINATAIFEKGELIDIAPFELKLYSSNQFEKKSFSSFSQAIDELIAELKSKNKRSSQKQIEIEKIKRIIENQKNSIDKLQQEETQYKKSAEFLYEHYNDINSLLSILKTAKENKSLKQLKPSLLKKKNIKEINEKENTVTLIIE